jgi:hypothetical protein
MPETRLVPPQPTPEPERSAFGDPIGSDQSAAGANESVPSDIMQLAEQMKPAGEPRPIENFDPVETPEPAAVLKPLEQSDSPAVVEPLEPVAITPKIESKIESRFESKPESKIESRPESKIEGDFGTKSAPPAFRPMFDDHFRLALTGIQSLVLAIVTFALVIGALGMAANGWVTSHDWSCRVGLLVKSCPTIDIPKPMAPPEIPT